MATDPVKFRGQALRIDSARPPKGARAMLFHLSTTNFWIIIVGVVLVIANALASSRLAPHISALFARRR
jgi:hypothetical protein